MKTFNRVFTVIVFLFLYIPMIVLAVASFNAGTDIAVWKGFTFAQYGALFRDGVLLPLLANSVIVAVIASLVGDGGRSFVLPFALITLCFAFWGFANDITNPMVKAFSKIFRMRSKIS